MTELTVGQSADFTKLAWGTSPEEPAEARYEERLIADLERILRYTFTARRIEAPRDAMIRATGALQSARAALNEKRPLSEAVEFGLSQSIDALAPVIRPATAASLEIAQLMEVGSTGGDRRQREIRRRVRRMITLWVWTTFAALFFALLAIGMKMLSRGETATEPSFALQASTYAIPLLLGLLGACCYILRTTLHGLANQTYVPREGTDILRSILGIILGFMIPDLLQNGGIARALGFEVMIVVPFLAGYSVDPIFGALDMIVVTFRDMVSQQPLFFRARRPETPAAAAPPSVIATLPEAGSGQQA